MTPPSPLWKALGATQPVFHVDDGSGSGATMDDSRITSISIEAGTTMAGLSTAGATVEVTGYQGYLQPEDTTTFDISLTAYGGLLLSRLTGRSAESLRPRFRGRGTAHDITDTSDGNRTTKMRTTLTAQDWASFISQLDKGALARRSDPNLWRLYRSLFARAGIPGAFTLEAWGTRWHWVRFRDAEPDTKVISTSDVLSKYLQDVGNFIRQDRNGYPKAWSHDHLQAIAADWRAFTPDPLQRSQVLSPVTWRRPATIPKSLWWQQTATVGDQTETGLGYSYTPSGTLVTRSVTLDMLHLWDIAWEPGAEGSGYTDAMRARYHREKATDLILDTVTVDILRLIERNQGTDRAVAGHVLNLNHGDPITLGYDWPSEVRGVQFAQKVSHKITRDQWTVSLDLVPAPHVTGLAKPADLAGRTWDTAYPQPTQWETPSTSWEASP